MAAGGDSLCPQCRQGTAADHQQGADDAEEGEFFAIDESRLPHGENLHEGDDDNRRHRNENTDPRCLDVMKSAGEGEVGDQRAQ